MERGSLSSLDPAARCKWILLLRTSQRLLSGYLLMRVVRPQDQGYRRNHKDHEGHKEKIIPVKYKSMNIDCACRADMVVDNKILLELKSVDKLHPIHEAQVLTYLKLSGLKLGLLINFNVTLLKLGIRRIIL